MSLPTNAQSVSDYATVYYPGPYNFTYNRNISGPLLNQAAANPNATRSIKFRPFPSYSGNNDRLRNLEWSWRVNISDFYAANASPSFSEDGLLEDPHVIVNTYDFSWPGGGNLSEQIGTTNPFCISAAGSFVWPANVTNRYADGDPNSPDCGAVLGEACRDAIVRQGASSAGLDKCSGPSKFWKTLPECAGSLGYAGSLDSFSSVTTFDFNGYNGTKPDPNAKGPASNATRVPGGTPNPASGTGFFAWNSYPRNATNMTEYYDATNRLHIVMINAALPIVNGWASKPTLMCMRVNTTKLEVEDEPDSSAVHVKELGTAATAIVAATMMLAWIM
ncbi:hypothetical protein PG999_012991 [Apiospora kogelbergensis]|uniref:Uncharacterized protein n=1 Tax=Apiospora kogelbergensis TaxID=1337665 RepID=A0AAW0Q9U5_9PEZI